MFWRQIPRATDVLSNRQSPALTQTPTSRASPEDEDRSALYSSRNAENGGAGRAFDSKREWKKAIRGVIDKGADDHDLKHVRDVVEAAVAVDRYNKNKLKGFSVRLRRRSSAARTKPGLDLEDDTPDPVTLAKITPFSSSPPESLCGRLRDDPDTATPSGRTRVTAADVPPSALDPETRVSKQSATRPASVQRMPYRSPNPSAPSSPASSDDDSALPPYEASDRFEPSRSRAADILVERHSALLQNHDRSRPQVDRRATIAAPISHSRLPTLPPPPIPFSVKSTEEVIRSPPQKDSLFEREAIAPPIRHGSARMPDPPRLARTRSSASIALRRNQTPYHEIFGMAGLANLGNSCYLSAVIQALAASEALADFLASGEYRREINRTNRNGSQGQIAEALSVLLSALSSGRHRVITAGRFRDIISAASHFDNYDQQDAHDFLLYLLDAIHEDLNLVHHPSPVPTNAPARRAELESLPEVIAADKEWATYREQNDSIIIDVFQGQMRNRMECLHCHETSTTYSPLQTLPLPIPTPQGGMEVQLEDCIDDFLGEEIMEGDNAWKCPRCRRPRTASKRLAITRLPQILIVQLKRFTSFSSFSSKVETPVDFPLDNLDLGYLLPPRSTVNNYLLNLPHETNTTFELYALVNHLGGENTSGHYTTIVRKGEAFLEIDDEHISSIPADELVDRCASSAYLLFYQLA